MSQRDKGFQFEIKAEKDRMTIFLKGPLDENANLANLLNPPPTIIFNFRGVTLLNSHGIVAWQKFLDKLHGTKIFLEECPTLVVRQMNLVPSFRGHAKVRSVYLAYVCDDCDEEKVELIDSAKFDGGKPNGIPETIPCEKCKKGSMVPDTKLANYFSFAR